MPPFGYQSGTSYDQWVTSPSMVAFLAPFLAIGLEPANGLAPVAQRQTTVALVAFNHSHSADMDGLCPRESRALTLWEPPATMPYMYRQSVLDSYGSIFSPSLTWPPRNEGVVRWFRWPQNLSLLVSRGDWLDRRHRVVMIAANKWSFHPESLYGLRRWAAAQEGVDLYGYAWGSPRDTFVSCSRAIKTSVRARSRISLKSGLGSSWETPSSFMGSCESKAAVLQEYKFALVIENSANYVSEKLFDALTSGCQVIYVGPPLEEYGIPTDGILQVGADPRALAKALAQCLSPKDAPSHPPTNLLQWCQPWTAETSMKNLGIDVIRALGL